MRTTIFKLALSQGPVDSSIKHFVPLLQSCAKNQMPNPGRQIHQWIIINGLQQIPFFVTSLINMYSKCRQPRDAVEVFRETIEPNVFAWNTLISGLVCGQFFGDAIAFYHKMRSKDVIGDKFTYPCVLKACMNICDACEGKKVHGETIKNGFCLDMFVSASLISFYLKFDAPDDVRKVFDVMPEREVVLWNSMITGYAQGGRLFEALEMFGLMEEEGIEFSKFTLTGILSVLAEIGDMQRGQKIHNYIKEHDLQGDVAVCNALIDLYGKCKCLNEARQVFDEMQQRDVVSWNSIISCYSQFGDHRGTLILFDEMRESGVLPDAITVSAVLPSCAHLAALRHGKQIHGYTIVKSIGKNDVYTHNAIMDMYVKCGSLNEAHLVFNDFFEKDLASWNIMIIGYGMHGYANEVLCLFEAMEKVGMIPDEITFVGILSACSHAGMFDRGIDLYNRMIYNYRLVPSIEHYACVVDMLGRAGRLHGAYSLLVNMHIEPNPVVWRAFLGACKLHGNSILGEKAAQKLFELEPGHCGNFVLLSNVYGDAGCYEEVVEIRKEMKSRGVKKIPGCSWIELDSGVHAFINGDRTHPHSDGIFDILHSLVGLTLHEQGYGPDMNLCRQYPVES